MKPQSWVADKIDKLRTRTDNSPAPQGVTTAPGAPAREAIPRDWSRMLQRVRTDVERITNFLEALAKHPRGLQKYHEEAAKRGG